MERVSLPKDPRGEVRGFAFITFAHEISVPYAIQLFTGTKLYNRQICCKTRNNQATVLLPQIPTPQIIEASNPLTGSALRAGFSNLQPAFVNHLQPIIRTIQNNIVPTNNPFQSADPNLLLALSSNFQPGSFSHMGMYNPEDQSYDRGGSHKMSRDRGSHRSHHSNNPYKDQRSSNNDHHQRDWMNGNNNRDRNHHSRRRRT